MSVLVSPHLASRRLVMLAAVTLLAGAGGMAISFVFLASSHSLDVIAGAAGFVAGSVLAAGGLLSLAVLKSPATVGGPSVTLTGTTSAEPPLDVERWVAHFRSNRADRPEPDWNAPLTLPAEAVRPLVRSLEQFQLGDGGGPAYLIAHDRARFLDGPTGARRLVDLWFTEEREHSRLLGAAVARFGGQCISSHWSFTAFCQVRRWFGVRFELKVLLLTEIVSTVYYRLLRRHGKDEALRAMCRLIMRDEAGHVAFHRDRLARDSRAGRATHGVVWELWFRTLGLGAATMLWVNHAAGLRPLGARTSEFYREVWRELTRFIRCLRRDVSKGT